MYTCYVRPLVCLNQLHWMHSEHLIFLSVTVTLQRPLLLVTLMLPPANTLPLPRRLHIILEWPQRWLNSFPLDMEGQIAINLRRSKKTYVGAGSCTEPVLPFQWTARNQEFF